MPKRRVTQDPNRPESRVPLEPTVTLANGGRARRCQYVRHQNQARPLTQCSAPAVTNADFCRTHGGRRMKDQIGPANPNWKGGSTILKPGRWQTRLPSPLQADYLAALRDPEILSLEDEIALIDVRLAELVSRVGPHSDWGAVKETYDALTVAMRESDSDGIRVALLRLRDLGEGNVENDKAWQQVMRLTDRRRSLVESERRRLVEQHLFMSREQVHEYASALLECVTRHVRDRETLLAIAGDFRVVIEPAQRRIEALATRS